METWTPVAVPMYATTANSPTLLFQVLGYGTESGMPVVVCVPARPGGRMTTIEQVRARPWNSAAEGKYGCLTVQASLSEARDVLRVRREAEARVVAEAERMLTPSLDDPWAGAA